MLSELIPHLEPYDSADLLASVAALQLIPENAEYTIRLEALSHAIASLVFERKKPQISPSRFRRIVRSKTLSNLKSMEDPFDNIFTEAFTFHGGSYVVFPSIFEESTYILRNLAQAIFLHKEPFPSEEFSDQAKSLLLAVLIISNEMAIRAGLSRNIEPKSIRNSEIFIPNSSQLTSFKQAVCFSRTEVIDLLTNKGVYPQILDELIIPIGSVNMDNYTFDKGILLQHPIIQVDDRFIIAIPGALLVAVRHLLICHGIRQNVQDELASRYNSAIWHNVLQSLDYLKSKPISIPLPVPTDLPCLREGFLNLDTDKLIYIFLLTHPLADYDMNQPVGHWSLESFNTSIEARILQIKKYIREELNPPAGALCLVLLESMGASLTEGFDLNRDEKFTPLFLSAAWLETISLLEGGNHLVLWKYAKSFWDIRETTKVMAFGLEEFHLYRENNYSYYFSDDSLPSFVAVTGSGGPGILRRKVLEQRDWHAVPSWNKGYVVEVTTLYDSVFIPIYVPLRSAKIGEKATVFVEGLHLPIWVVSPQLSDPKQQQLWKEYFEFCEGIAYWIWQFTSAITPVIEIISKNHTQILIELYLPIDDAWYKRVAFDQKLDETPIEILADLSTSTIHITFRPSVGALFEGADNSGERNLVYQVLTGFRKFLPANFHHLLSDQQIDVLLDTYAPLGLKKKIISLDPNNDPALMPGKLPSYRSLQQADEQLLLDEIGRYLRKEKDCRLGHVFKSKTDKTNMLRETVGYLYLEVCELVSSLDVHDLLNWLLAHHETIVNTQAHNALTIPTRIACFGSDVEMVKQLRNEYPLASRTALASRFLIEYVASQPPNGERIMSFEIYDRLMACADLITGYGFGSDLIQFDLADIGYKILPSGRLGVDQRTYHNSREAYFQIFATGHIVRSRRAFGRHTGMRASSTNEKPDWTIKIDNATQIEFGFSITELGMFMGDAITIGYEQDDAVAKLEMSEFIARLSDSLGWSEAKIGKALDLLSLKSRDDYLTPPSPHNKNDVWPWRFNRSLSYLRRPFVQLEKDNSTIVLWGIRHVSAAFEYLTQICLDGRLKAHTKELKQVLSGFKNEVSEEFNDQVADLFATKSNLIVKRRLKKIGKVKIEDSSGELGDIDVLVVDPKHRHVKVIECKDFAGARAPHKLANEIGNLLAGQQGRKSTVEKHQNRTDWIRENLGIVLEVLDVRYKGKWQVSPIIVANRELMTPHLWKSPIPIISLIQLKQMLEFETSN